MRHLGGRIVPFRFLALALGRFLEELPGRGDGLTRSERTTLRVIAEGRMTAKDVFPRLLAAEEAAFMGDWSALRLLDDLAFAAEPLVSGVPTLFPCRGEEVAVADYLAAPLALTRVGRAILGGTADTIAINGIDRWWAGTHMTGHDCWRWDDAARRLVPPGEI